MSQSDDAKLFLETLKDTQEMIKDVSSDYQDTRLALKEVSTDLKNVSKEVKRSRDHLESLERRVTIIESQAQGAEKTGGNIANYVSLLVAIGAAITGLIGLLR